MNDKYDLNYFLYLPVKILLKHIHSNDDALFVYAQRLCTGKLDVPLNINKGLKILTKLAKRHLPSRFELGKLYLSSSSTKELGFEYILSAVEDGYQTLDSLTVLAECYERGIGTAINAQKAYQYYLLAESKGDGSHYLFLLKWSLSDEVKANYYLDKLLNQGTKYKALYELKGYFFEIGFGVTKDYKEAISMVMSSGFPIDISTKHKERLLKIMEETKDEDLDKEEKSFIFEGYSFPKAIRVHYAQNVIEKEKEDIRQKDKMMVTEIEEALNNEDALKAEQLGLKLYHEGRNVLAFQTLLPFESVFQTNNPEVYEVLGKLTHLPFVIDEVNHTFMNIDNGNGKRELENYAKGAKLNSKKSIAFVLRHFFSNEEEGHYYVQCLEILLNNIAIVYETMNEEGSIYSYLKDGLPKMDDDQACFLLGKLAVFAKQYEWGYRYFAKGKELKGKVCARYYAGILASELSFDNKPDLNDEQITALVQEAADMGDGESYGQLGFNYFIKGEYQKAKELFLKGDEVDSNEICNFYLGALYEYGLGVEKNLNIAYKYYTKDYMSRNKSMPTTNEKGLYFNYHYNDLLNELISTEVFTFDFQKSGYVYKHDFFECSLEVRKITSLLCLNKQIPVFNDFVIWSNHLMTYINNAFKIERLIEENKKTQDKEEKKKLENQLMDLVKKGVEVGECISIFTLGSIKLQAGQYDEAYQLFIKAHGLGGSSPLNFIAEMYAKGLVNNKRDLNKAIEWIDKSIRFVNKPSILLRAIYRLYRSRDINDYLEAEKLLLQIANRNHSALVYLAVLYSDGKCGPVDFTKAEEYFQKAFKYGKKDSQLLELAKTKYAIFLTRKDELERFLAEENDTNSGSYHYRYYEIYSYYSGHIDPSKAKEHLYKAADLGHALACKIIYQENYDKWIQSDKKEINSLYIAKDYAHRAYDLGIDDLEDIVKELDNEYEIIENSRLDISGGYDIFISWCTKDIDFKEELVKNLNAGGIKTWNSDNDGKGMIDANIQSIIRKAKGFIIIVSSNAIKYSNYMRKEVNWIMERIAKENLYLNKTILKVILVDDVSREIPLLDDSDAFKKLCGLLYDFTKLKENTKTNKDFTNEVFFANEVIKLDSLRQYVVSLAKENMSFPITLSHYYDESKRISPTLDIEKAYINRPLIDDSNNQYDIESIKNINDIVLLYGDGGSGKSLYFKHMIRENSSYEDIYFFISAQEAGRYISLHQDCTFEDIVAYISFKNGRYRNIDASVIKDILKADYKKCHIIIDALDETSALLKESIIIKINDFGFYDNIHYYFTSRSKSDALDIQKFTHRNVKALSIKELDDQEIALLFDAFYTRNINQMDIESSTHINKEMFLDELQYVAKEIRKNPLLISILIFIYFSEQKIKRNRLDVLESANEALVSHLESDKGLSETQKQIKELLGISSINILLERIAYSLSIDKRILVKDIIQDVLTENNNNTLENVKLIEDYLRSRKFIIANHFSHEIFASFYASKYIFAHTYQSKLKAFKYIDKDFLFVENKDEIISEETPWPSIVVDLICKIDYEFHYSLGKGKFDETSPLYQSFDIVMGDLLKEGTVSLKAIAMLKEVLNLEGALFFSDYIKRYI